MNRLAFMVCLLILIPSGCADDHSKQGHGSADGPEAMIIQRTRQGQEDTAKKSIKAYVKNNINGVRFYISYHSPAVRDRIIWGGLVPFDKVWVTGAHMATSIEVDNSITINGKEIPEGKYAFFTIPGRNEWTLVLNKNWDQHLADEYDEKQDVIRWSVKPDSLSHLQERLMYDIDQTGERRCNIEMRWEKLKLVIPVRIND